MGKIGGATLGNLCGTGEELKEMNVLVAKLDTIWYWVEGEWTEGHDKINSVVILHMIFSSFCVT